ncbi:MAG: pyruvate formate-lyase-activating protein [Desulfobacterales bacterium]|nr:pyruvate formate-lyase-activating protein [Desulfobacterales bacterium]
MEEDNSKKPPVSVSQMAGSRYDILECHIAPDAEGPDAPVEDPKGLSGYIHSYETMGTADGPGMRFVLFLTGCPLRCQYCHNPDTWHLKNGNQVTVGDVMAEIEKYADFLIGADGGVTISGGEPLVQPKFLAAILSRCKQRGLHTAVDTSGFLGRRLTDAMLADTDMVLLDIKSWDPETYKAVTGVGIEPTLEFARRLDDDGTPVWVRYVLVPGLTDGVANVDGVADFLGTLSNVERVEVLPFHKMGEHKWEVMNLDYQLKDTGSPSEDLMQRVLEQFRKKDLTAY